MLPPNLPKWKDLPPVPGMPHGTAWGVFDNPDLSGDAQKDSFGTLNHITPTRTLAAASEIKTGKSVNLNWGLEHLSCPGFGRKKLEWKVVDWLAAGIKGAGDEEGGVPTYTFDDEIAFNSQVGSQWDGLRHWGHSKTGLYYNGIHHNDIIASPHLGIEQWSNKGGLCTRGLLLDYPAYCNRHSIYFDPVSRHPITLPTLNQMIEEASLTPRPGDILIVRTGFIHWYNTHDQKDKENYITNGSAWIGVEGSQDVVEFLWNTGFAAVAGDSIGFECWPPSGEGEWRLHDHLLSMLGMPIGEMWDLEKLARECERQQRWSFFLTSAPLNINGGVASPPNALAIF